MKNTMRNDANLKRWLCGLLAIGCFGVIPAQANERESLEQLRNTTINLIKLLVQQGVLSQDKADGLIKQAEEDAAKAAEAKTKVADVQGTEDDEKVVRVQYVPEFVKNQMRDEIKKEVMAKAQSEGWAYPGSIPDWLNRFEWEGDLRLRYEKDRFQEGNATPLSFQLQGDNLNNTHDERERYRVRARLGAKLNISDSLKGGVRFTTGSVDDPVSPNQTMGGDYKSSSKFSFALDRAYLQFSPYSWVSASGGRIANPWYGTDLVWDSDLAFDGAAVTFKPKFSDRFKGFATLGAFPIQEVETSNDGTPVVKAKDRWLYGAQVGIEWNSVNESAFKMGVAYYDFTNMQGKLNPLGLNVFDKTARQFHQKGNTVFDIANPFASTLTDPIGLASDFREVNLTGSLDIAAFNPVHIVLSGDYVKNIAFDEKAIRALGPLNAVGGDTGWMAKLLIGKPETLKRNDWNVYGFYKHLESDAVLDAYTDSDFHMGGTNTKGWTLGANYGLDKNTWLNVRWMSADEIVGLPLSVDVLMVDINAKF